MMQNMPKHRVFKTALVLMALGIALGLFLMPGAEPHLVEALDKAEEHDELTFPEGLHAIDLQGVSTPLWIDRAYHLAWNVPRLEEFSFVPIPRNARFTYALEVRVATTLLTLANTADLRGLDDWTILPDSVYVHDAYAPRSMDRLLALEVNAGIHRIRSPEGGPVRPVFFDPGAVRLVTGNQR